MAVPSTIADLSVTASVNSPSGSEPIGIALDDYLRAHAAIIAQLGVDKADAADIIDYSASSGSSLVGFLQSGTGATARTLQSKSRDFVSVKDFGAVGDGVTNDLPAILLALDAVDTAGGGKIYFPAGSYAITSQLSIGNGSNAAQSTKHHRITLVGDGYGTGSEVSNTEIAGATKILYTGSASSTAAVISFEGPLHSVGLENIQLDANSLAGYGININHVTQGTFSRVSARNFTSKGWNLTTRTGFVSGVAYGNADNRFYDCYGFNPANTAAHGVYVDSGVSTATSLSGQPDSARNIFIGGTFAYGGDTGSYGVYMSGADNNQFQGTHFLPKGGSAGGYDVYLNQWPASGDFPKENVFLNCGMTRGVSGNSGTGPTGGNYFLPYQTADGAPVPTLSTAQVKTFDGKEYINGVRAYRSRQVGYYSTQTPQARSVASYADMTGYTLTVDTKASTRLLVSYTARAAKATTGTGNMIVNVNGSDQGETYRDAGATGYYQSLAAETVVDVGAGSQVIKLRFQSSDTNAFTVDRGTLTVLELY